MVKGFIAVCVLAIFSTTNTYGQTKQQTADWLNAKVNSLRPAMFHGRFRADTSGHIQWVHELWDRYNVGKWSVVNGFRLYFTYVSSIDYRYEADHGGSHIIVFTANPQYPDPLMYKVSRTPDDPVPSIDRNPFTPSSSEEKTVKSATLVFPASVEKSEIDRIIKALKHLASLTGARLVKDDLF